MAVGVGQKSFAEIDVAVPPVRNLDARNVFAQVATPEYFRLNPEDYVDIDKAAIEAAAPARLKSFLVDVSRGSSKLTVGYTPENDNREHYVSLYPYEYGLIPRTILPARYGETALAAALKGKKSFLSSRELRESEAEEIKMASIKKKHADIDLHLKIHLNPELEMLKRLLEAAKHPGLQRRKEIDTRVAVATVRDWMLPQVLEVVGRNKNWKDEQYDLAKRAIDYRLFFMRSENHHIRNWVDMLTLLRDYDQEKVNLFADRAGIFAGYLAQHDKTKQ